MFGVKQNLRNYLDTIRGWAMGVNNRGWVHEDFETQQAMPAPPAVATTYVWTPIDSVHQYRTDPSHVIFPILPYRLGLLDRLFLGRKRIAAVLNLNQSISNFNAMLDAVNSAPDSGIKWTRTVMLHTGMIGTLNTGGLYDRFMDAARGL